MMHSQPDNSSLDLDDMASLLKMLQTNQDETGRGVLSIPPLGVNVHYDLYDGNVGPITFVQAIGDVKVIYSEEVQNALKQQVTQQIKDAIALLAKLYLLERLVELGDEKISKLIKSRHYGVQ